MFEHGENSFESGENMKYKYEFEAEESFEKGYCYACPFHYMDYHEYEGHCVLGTQFDECPLEEVEEVEE